MQPLVLTTKEVAMVQRREPSEQEISHLAYALYLQRGCEQGKDVEDWVRAEKELSNEPVGGPAKTRVTEAGRNVWN